MIKEAGENLKQEENAEYLSIGQDKSLQFKVQKISAPTTSAEVGMRRFLHAAPQNWSRDSDMPYKTIGNSGNNLCKTYLDEQETASAERALDKLNWFSGCLNIEKYGSSSKGTELP